MYTKLNSITFSVFTEISKIRPLKVFNYIGSDLLDLYFSAKYSESYLSDIGEMDQAKIAQIVNGLYGNKWDNLVEYNTNIFTVFKSGEIETRVGTTTNSNTNNSTTVNSVSAFNDDNFTNNDNSVINSTNKTDESQNYKITRNNTNNLNNITLYLQNNLVFDTIFTDLKNLVTTKYYFDNK